VFIFGNSLTVSFCPALISCASAGLVYLEGSHYFHFGGRIRTRAEGYRGQSTTSTTHRVVPPQWRSGSACNVHPPRPAAAQRFEQRAVHALFHCTAHKSKSPLSAESSEICSRRSSRGPVSSVAESMVFRALAPWAD
jgi:hypothetical protein